MPPTTRRSQATSKSSLGWTKTIASQAPDVTVIVGSGDNSQEFQCYGAILASASPVLDAMLSSGMMESENRRITFPTKDPEEWKIIMCCMDSENAFLFQQRVDYERGYKPQEDELINCLNVKALAPWFNELQMQNYSERCDWILLNRANELERVKGRSLSTQESLEILDLMVFASKFNLFSTHQTSEITTLRLLEQFCWGFGDPDIFSLSRIQQVVELFYPIKLRDEDRPTKKQRCENVNILDVYKTSDCGRIWTKLASFVDLSILSIDMINDGNALSHLFYYALHDCHKSAKLELSKVVSKLVGKEGPCCLTIKDSSNRKHQVAVGTQGVVLTEIVIWNAASALAKECCARAGAKLDRNYSLSKDGKTIYLVNKPSNCEAPESKLMPFWFDSKSFIERDGGIRSSKEDLTVVVGSGDGAKEFQCHSTILAFSSLKLDSMIKEASGRLLLPKVQPEHWLLFLKCIDPWNNGRDLSAGYFGGLLYNSQILALAKLFREFEMSNYLKCCALFFEDRMWTEKGIEEYVQMLQFAVELDCLAEFQETVEEELTNRVLDESLDLELVQDIVSLCLPLERTSGQNRFISRTCPILWQGLSSHIGIHLESVVSNKIDTNDFEVFSLLVYCFLHNDDLEYAFVRDLVSRCLPIKRSSAQEPFVSEGCPMLWQGMISCIESHHLESLVFDEVKEIELDMFSHLMHSFFLIESLVRN